ncbi:MAG: RNA methyltransferase [Ruminococcaceae bacterium]|nr:RNA methyltransferase [Oscillospiraceae bacterium]
MLPNEFLQRMQRLLGEEYDDFLASYERPRNMGIRLNPQKQSKESLQFCAEQVPWEANGYYLKQGTRPGLHPLHDAGAYYLQEPSAMAPVGFLQAQPGERVLDLCAAPGGKTTQIAAAMSGQGLLVCNEIHPKRARILASNIERMGVSNALALNEHPKKLEERFVSYFDRILVDAPCSGEGMFRKEDAAVSDWSLETVRMCADRQLEILTSAAKMLISGGRLVYSTCTFAPEENEGVIHRFLQRHPNFYVEKVDAPWFSCGHPEWVEDADAGVRDTFRLLPHKLFGEGHFAAVLRKKGECDAQEMRIQKTEKLPKAITDFLEKYDINLPHDAVRFGQTYYSVPEMLPSLDGLKVMRVGLELGEMKKDRFEPAHALALWLNDFKSRVDFSSDSTQIAAYLRGETISADRQGWTLVFVDGVSLGWAKGSQGVLKNHYPKGLRKLN